MPAHRKNLVSPLWTSNLAYAVGLIVTDGNLSKDGRHINFRSADIDLVETLKHCLDLKAKIGSGITGAYTSRISYRIQWGDVVLYKWLMKIGLMPAKSLIMGSIDIPDEYFRDFLRGHLDGDGTVLSYIDKYNNYRGRNYAAIRLYVYFISASYKHIEWLTTRIRELTPLKGSLESQTKIIKDRKSTIHRIKFSKKEALKLLDWIYYREDLPSLQRKSSFARQLMAEIPMWERKEYIRVD